MSSFKVNSKRVVMLSDRVHWLSSIFSSASLLLLNGGSMRQWPRYSANHVTAYTTCLPPPPHAPLYVTSSSVCPSLCHNFTDYHLSAFPRVSRQLHDTTYLDQFTVVTKPKGSSPVQRKLETEFGRETNHSPPSSAGVKNSWSYTSTPTHVFMEWYLVKSRRQLYPYAILPSVRTMRSTVPVLRFESGMILQPKWQLDVRLK
jgi:hypothetical protein